jgi:hypothetical protein
MFGINQMKKDNLYPATLKVRGRSKNMLVIAYAKISALKSEIESKKLLRIARTKKGWATRRAKGSDVGASLNIQHGDKEAPAVD